MILCMNYAGRARRISAQLFVFVAFVCCGLGPGLASNAWSETPLIFSNDFESGDTCAWQGNCPAPQSVAGVWVGVVDFDGTSRPMTIQLEERNDGRLIGYVFGGTPRRTVTGGTYGAGSVTFDLEMVNPTSVQTLSFAGLVSGQVMSGTLSGDIATQPVEFRHWPGPVVERQLAFVDSSLGDRVFQSLAVVLGDQGDLISGGFSAPDNCLLWACGGGVTSFHELGDTITIGLETDGGCSAGSGVTVTRDPTSGLYFGTYSFTDCDGTNSGSLVGGLVHGTRSTHSSQILQGLALVADQFEAGTAFVSPHPAFANDYHHNGVGLASLFSTWNTELADYTDLESRINRVRLMATIAEPNGLPFFAAPMGVEFDFNRTGIPVSGGGPREILVETEGDLLFNVARNPLRVWQDEGGQWLIRGNQESALDLPWNYTVAPAGDRLDTPTDRDPVHVSIGVYAGHFQPHAGHAYGDPKTNNIGFLPLDDSELDELIGDGIGNDDGVCEPNETCAYYGGLSGDGSCVQDGCLVRDRTPVYVAPQSGRITRIQFEGGPTGVYFDDPPHWEVELTFGSGIRYRLGHVAAFEGSFAAKVAAATGCDPDNWALCGLNDGDSLLEELAGDAPIPVAAGESICVSQIMAPEMPGYPGYHLGDGGHRLYPWAQMEIFVTAIVDGRELNVSMYQCLSDQVHETLEDVAMTDMLEPQSMRYVKSEAWERWKWAAETALSNGEARLKVDFSTLFSGLGGWFERQEVGTTPDEIFGWVPMRRDGLAYDSSLYDPIDPDAVILRQRQHGLDPFIWDMPDGSTVEPYYPGAEVLEHTANNWLLKWRDIAYTPGDIPVYQRAAYLLDENGLKVKWGTFGNTPAEAPQPVLSPGEACNDNDVLCYNHQPMLGF